MDVFGAAAQRNLLAALASLVAIVFWPALVDPVNLPKATLAAVVALLLVAIGLVRVIALRRVVLPTGPVPWAALAMGVGLVLATLLSDVPAASWTGVLGRSDGLLLYGACLICFMTVVRVYDASTVRVLLCGLLVGGVFLAAYGLLQTLGVDAVNWADVGISQIIGTLGNPDFEAAYVGVMLPLAAWGALTRTWAPAWRVASAVLAGGCLAVAVASTSRQGLLAGAAGLLVIAVALLLARGDRLGRVGLGAVGGFGVAVALMVALGVATGVGPGDRVVGAESLAARKWYWSSALDMWRAHPLTGVGLDRYGAYYRSVRPAEAAAVSNYSDAAHSVPLHLLATGGLLVAIPYMAIMLLVLVALARGLLRAEGEARLLLAGIGGAWIAYQVQSLVSIDQPALAVTHWLLAGAVIALAAPPKRWEKQLPGAIVPKPRRGRAAAVSLEPPLNWSGTSVAGAAVVVIVTAVSVWMVIIPLRADRAARAAAEELAKGHGNATLAHLTAATGRAPHEAAYWLKRGRFLEQVQQLPLAAQAYADGIERDPRSYDLLVAAAQLGKKQNDQPTVDRYAAELHRVDPSDRWRSELGD